MNQNRSTMLRASHLRISSLILMIAALLGGCASQRAFVGKWQRHVISVAHPEGTTELLTFSPDGVVTLRPPPFSDMSDTGHYQIIDRHLIRVELYGINGVCTTKVEGAELRFTDPNGRTTVYERVR